MTITQGAGAGAPIVLLPWQRRFLRGFERTEGDVALSIARGAGKSTITAGIACAAVAGPLAEPRGEVVCVAGTFVQSRIVFEHAKAFLAELGHDLGDRELWRSQDSQNMATLEYRPTGARIRCLGGDPKRMHGLAPRLVLADEPAQWDATKRDRALAALRTSMGKVPGSRFVALGTKSADETHWFSRMLNGAADYVQSHAARPADPPFHVRTWRRANPSLVIMPDLEKRIRREAEEARADPDALAAFKALRLNLGTDDTAREVLIELDAWKTSESTTTPRRGALVLGLDLGTNGMSAAAACWSESGRIEVMAAMPSVPGFAERGLADGVGRLYCNLEAAGELVAIGHAVVPVAAFLDEAFRRFGGLPDVIISDAWREAELRDALFALGADVPLLTRRMGWYDGSDDLRRFRSAVLTGTVRPVPSPLLRAAMAEARVAADPAGNRKLIKSRSKSRDDAAVACMLGAAEVQRMRERPIDDDAMTVVGVAFG